MFYTILPPQPPLVPKDNYVDNPPIYLSRADVGDDSELDNLANNSERSVTTSKRKDSAQTQKKSRVKSKNTSKVKASSQRTSQNNVKNIGSSSREYSLTKKNTISPEPEKFPPEFSPNIEANSAGALGKPLGIKLNLVDTREEIKQVVIESKAKTRKLVGQKLVNNQLSLTNKLKTDKVRRSQRNIGDAAVTTVNNSIGTSNKNKTKNKNKTRKSFSFKKPVPLSFNTHTHDDTWVPTIGNRNSQKSKPQKSKLQKPNNLIKTPIIEFKSRQGNTVKKTFTLSQQSPQTEFKLTPPQNTESQDNQQQNQQTTPNQIPNNPEDNRRIVEVIADKQEYDEKRRIITASGKVVVRFQNAVVDADSLQVSLENLIAVGEGNVALKRGEQTLRGERFTYNFVQDAGELKGGSGEIFVPSVGNDLSFDPSTSLNVTKPPLSDRALRNQPTQGVSSPGGVNIDLGGAPRNQSIPTGRAGGSVRRLRFQADSIDFYPRGWEAKDVRITNDPFSPPELELRANTVTLTRESPFRDKIRTRGQRLVFDQGFSLGIPKNSQTIDRRERDATPAIASIGFDGDKRGGLFIERKFEAINQENFRFSITPQFFIQEAIQNGTDNLTGLFGLKTQASATISPKTSFRGTASLTSLNLDDFDNNFRADLRLTQQLGDVNPHILNVQYGYRDRLYNGTLGFQTVQSSFGGVITSPVIPLGKSGLRLRYQGGAQLINANSDRLDILEQNRDNNRISLGRFQGSATIDGNITLWRGKGLPPTKDKGLRYTPNPVVPYLNAFGVLTGTTSLYSNGDSQNVLLATVGLQGQIGNFSKKFLDYTAFNISYSQGLNDGLSPFLFDRFVDDKVVNLGISQQLYGPIRLGFQTSINVETGESRSTDYILEYSRRTYGVSLRYNPVLELGGISFRISDFNWSGGTDPFSDDSEVRSVEGGKVGN